MSFQAETISAAIGCVGTVSLAVLLVLLSYKTCPMLSEQFGFVTEFLVIQKSDWMHCRRLLSDLQMNKGKQVRQGSPGSQGHPQYRLSIKSSRQEATILYLARLQEGSWQQFLLFVWQASIFYMDLWLSLVTAESLVYSEGEALSMMQKHWTSLASPSYAFSNSSTSSIIQSKKECRQIEKLADRLSQAVI